MQQPETQSQQIEVEAPEDEIRDENQPHPMQIEGQEPVVEEKKKERKQQARLRVKPEILIDANNGLHKLKKTTKETIKRLERAEPERFVGSILSDVRNWSMNLLPRYDYSYFLERVQTVGKDPAVTTMMSRLRALHVGEIQENEFMELYDAKDKELMELEKAAKERAERETNKPQSQNPSQGYRNWKGGERKNYPSKFQGGDNKNIYKQKSGAAQKPNQQSMTKPFK